MSVAYVDALVMAVMAFGKRNAGEFLFLKLDGQMGTVANALGIGTPDELNSP